MIELPPSPEGQVIALDLETTGLDWRHDHAFAMALSYPGRRDYCLDLRDPNQLQWAKDHVWRARALVNHNIKFDLHFLMKMGIRFPRELHDTMIYAALIFEHHGDYSLEYLGQRYVGVGKDDTVYQKLADLFGGEATRKGQMPRLHQAPRDIWAPYAMQDTRTTYTLWEWQMPELERQGLGRVRDLEMRLLPVLLRMEHRGVRVDIAGAEAAIPEITTHVDAQQDKLRHLIGWDLNVNSPKQMAKLFEPKLQENGWYLLNEGSLVQPTDSGKSAKLDANMLRLSPHPAAATILDIKVMKKIRDTFLKGHVLASHVNGLVHTTYNQTRTETDDGDLFGTGSGRLSSSNPNLQQTSKRNKAACRIVRRLFLPDEGTSWISGDFSQIDFRVMAHYLNDPMLNAAYWGPEILSECSDGKMRAISGPKTDYHQKIAVMNNLPRDPTPASRACAKTINLGLAFGMGQGRLAEEMGMPFIAEKQSDGRVFKKAGPEAMRMFDHYHQGLPGLKGLLKSMTDVAKNRGYIRTLLGRRCRFPGGDGAYKAGPYCFQGGAAELMKLKLVEIDEMVAPGRLMLTVHDSVEISGDPGDIARLKEVYQRNSLGLRVPIESEWSSGPSWYDAG